MGCYSGSAGKVRPVILEKSQSSRKKDIKFSFKTSKNKKNHVEVLQKGFCLDGHTRQLIFYPDLQVGDEFFSLLSPLTLGSEG